MPTYILLFQCKDQKGIVAKISDFIYRLGGNIVTADQHSTDPEQGHFFMRVEFMLSPQGPGEEKLGEDFSPVGAQFKADWKIYHKQKKLRMGILLSRPDHCLADILYLWNAKELHVEIPFVISNSSVHKKLAAQYNLDFHYLASSKNERREDELLSLVREKTDFLVLARYMLILSGDFLSAYGKDIINIHHGFLPSFRGANPYRQALENGVKVIGATAHFVNDQLDSGPIISQEVAGISHKDDMADLVRKGRNLEKMALADAISKYVDYRIIRHQNKTIVF